MLLIIQQFVNIKTLQRLGLKEKLDKRERERDYSNDRVGVGDLREKEREPASKRV